MKIFKAEQVREADAYTIKNEPISSIDLMERAATQLSTWIKKKYPVETRIVIIVGPGNNGGDGLVVARHLLESKYKVQVCDVGISKNYSEDFLVNQKRLETITPKNIQIWDKNKSFINYDLIIDAIFGSGLTRPIEGKLSELVLQMNNSGKEILAVDIPSGLFGEDNSGNIREHIVKANYTLTFQFPKLSFLLPENEAYVGEFEVLDIGIHQDFIRNTETEYYLTEKEDISLELFKRKKFSHKGTFGHAFIFAGSNGKMGASILANKACLRSGSGLLTTLVSQKSESIIQVALPEAMTVSYTESENLDIDIDLFSGIGVGPGIGRSENSLKLFELLLSKLKKPAVFDADALNLLSENPELLTQVPRKSIFTPHPKELERLIGKTKDNYSRLYKSQEFAKKHQIYLLIKGAFSVIVTPEGTFHFNNTGNPGMATAGSGDVLTGIITSFLAQGLDAFEALKMGVYIHGLAGDIAKQKHGEASLIASDIIENIGKALSELGV